MPAEKKLGNSLSEPTAFHLTLAGLQTWLSSKGLEGIKKFQVMVFEPIRPMLAERLASPEEILDKLGGKCAAEYKYDGERVQAHKKDDKVILFSRRLENISSQYPDAVDLIKEKIGAKEAILEAECVAMDLETGDMRPFQELMHRRRKYGVEEAISQYPISLFPFDLLYVDGKDLTQKPLRERRKELQEIVEGNRPGYACHPKNRQKPQGA